MCNTGICAPEREEARLRKIHDERLRMQLHCIPRQTPIRTTCQYEAECRASADKAHKSHEGQDSTSRQLTHDRDEDTIMFLRTRVTRYGVEQETKHVQPFMSFIPGAKSSAFS
jgi:hypothetical protein